MKGVDATHNTQQKTIIICGGGLAGYLTAAHLSNQLRSSHRILLLPNVGSSAFDFMYGGATAPTAYEFLRSIGLDEPTLIQNTSTSFSFGTRIQSWPKTDSDWVLCHHLPLPALHAVPFQHHLARAGADLQGLLVSAAAAKAGKFAHPPQDPKVPLSRAEYGYQFDADELVSLLQKNLARSAVEIRSEAVTGIDADGETISGVSLETGEQLRGELYIDCTGPERTLLTALNETFKTDRTISARTTSDVADRLGPASRELIASASGWEIKTHLQGRAQSLRLSSDQGEHALSIGRVDAGWRGNCVALGLAAYAMEPLTPAPMMLLQADIERLLELIPVSSDCRIERKEYNRRFNDDVSHARLFQDALLVSSGAYQTPFWEEAVARVRSEALDRKIAQYEHRGLLVKYDLEPFNDEDWLILHHGMGRTPNRFDRQAERATLQDTQKQLSGLRSAVQQIVTRMPPHHDYVVNLKRYLEKQKHG
jgi:tryptophan halogenase